MKKSIQHIALVGAIVAPLVLGAQGPARGPGGPGGPPAAGEIPAASVTHILNARRALDLTPRQIVQLDSIERALFVERRAVGERMRTLRDSVGGQARERVARGERAMTDAQRDSVRSRMQALRPQLERLRSRDSSARAAAQRVLTDAQRQQVREMQAEERGRQRGLREARGAQMRGQMRGQPRGGMRGQAPGGMPGGMRGQMPGRMREGMRGPRPDGMPGPMRDGEMRGQRRPPEG